MDFFKLAGERWSVRKFTDEPLSKDIIDKIIAVSHLAPTGCNYQPQRILVINSEKGLEKLRKCTKCHFGAPCAILVCYCKDECWTRKYDGKTSGVSDACIVATHMMLEAASIGIGTTWVMHFDPAAMRNEFSIPENIEPVALLVMGHPHPEAQPMPLHSEFRPLDEVIIYNTF